MRALIVLFEFFLACLLAPAIPAAAQQPPPRCDAAEHRQFDFWVDTWEVTGARGQVAGESTITAVHEGCALREEWRGAGGYTGTSINFYDPTRGVWHQTWIGSGGQALYLEGGLDAEGRMVLRTAAPAAAGGAAAASGDAAEPAAPLDRITWTPNPDGSVRQFWERSTDGGATWSTAFDGTYRKK